MMGEVMAEVEPPFTPPELVEVMVSVEPSVCSSCARRHFCMWREVMVLQNFKRNGIIEKITKRNPKNLWKFIHPSQRPNL